MELKTIIGHTQAQPRPYQERIVNKTSDMFMGRHRGSDGKIQKPSRSVLIQSPTGSGKTIMALLAARLLQEQNPELVVGWVAMRRNLLAQARKENVEKEIGVQNIHYTSMFDKYPEALLNAKEEGKQVLLVIDEAQHDAAASCAHLHNIVEPEMTLGMTATPFRTDRMKLCFDSVIQDAGIHRLIQDGYLSQYNHYTIQDWRPETVCKHYLSDPERWGKSIFYFQDLSLCSKAHEILEGAGITVDTVTGDSDWESQLKAFRNGDVRCLINCMKLTEGFDEPALHTAWVRDSGKGCTMQMGGRAFRIHPKLPVKNIVQSKNTRWPFIRTAMPHMQYLWQNDAWASLKVNPQIEEINQNARVAIAQIEVTLPQFLLNKQKKKRAPVF